MRLILDFFKTIGASALTDHSIDVPTGGIEAGVPITYVPFRNGIFLCIATAIAEKEGCSVIAIGVVEEDSSGYPDCREAFIRYISPKLPISVPKRRQISLSKCRWYIFKNHRLSKKLLNWAHRCT